MNTTAIETELPATQVAGATRVQPYLSFRGRCEEALNYYRAALGAKVTVLMRYKDSPVPTTTCAGTVPGDQIMHAEFQVGETTLLATDCAFEGEGYAGIALTVTYAEDAAAERDFAALAEQGQVRQPLIATFFASKFGVVKDRYGVTWMLLAGPAS